MTDTSLHELDIPEGLDKANVAVEVVRAWIADGALHVTFDPETFGSEHGEWGRMLSEIAHHVARASALSGLGQEEDVMAAISAAFVAGSGAETDQRSGNLAPGSKH